MATTPFDDDRFYLSVTRLLGIGFANSYQLKGMAHEPIAWSEVQRIAELNHKINSPLAAIRNALYLAGRRIDDPEVLKYLDMAYQEIGKISQALQEARYRAGDLALRGDRKSAGRGRRHHAA